MIRGGSSLGRIARLVALALVAVATMPATVGAQSPAVDEYTLDIPGGGGSQPGDPNAPPPTGAEGSGSSGGGGGSGISAGDGGEGGGDGSADQGQGGSGEGAREVGSYQRLHGGGTGGSPGSPIETGSRSAPEVVADSLTDGPMLPLLAALVVITAIGAWRILRHRRTLTRASG
jgi:hypothetical protein